MVRPFYQMKIIAFIHEIQLITGDNEVSSLPKNSGLPKLLK